MMTIFAFIWSAGANVLDSISVVGRNKLSKFIKTKIMGFYQGFPFEGETYDYYIDFKSKTFLPWAKIIPEFIYDP